MPLRGGAAPPSPLRAGRQSRPARRGLPPCRARAPRDPAQHGGDWADVRGAGVRPGPVSQCPTKIRPAGRRSRRNRQSRQNRVCQEGLRGEQAGPTSSTASSVSILSRGPGRGGGTPPGTAGRRSRRNRQNRQNRACPGAVGENRQARMNRTLVRCSRFW